ncbi:hypothetical protein BV22DRAFT_907796 [Leucogyrophana mollusca]|uniref:Uncharacterized protein n=1 Tax=Leucogyrophana mollusca TaxID=85980 RepID=A0ACB8AZ95_9AGAM|nr:hypothetical protein BV22DRAFT_907796 [Leucogyrophana mollusca]
MCPKPPVIKRPYPSAKKPHSSELSVERLTPFVYSMLFRPAAIFLAAGICAMRATASGFYEVALYTGTLLDGFVDYYHIDIGHKFWGDVLACGSCQKINAIPAGHLHSWAMQASRKVNLRFYAAEGCKNEYKKTYTAGGVTGVEELNVQGDLSHARSFKGCAVK